MASKKQTQQHKKPDAAKVAAKKARREERKAAEAAARKAAARKKRIRTYSILGVVVLAAGALLFALFGALFPGELEGVEQLSSEGRTHVPAGTPVTYANATPTSGTHVSQAPSCGIYTEPLPLEFAVHALEHGVIVLWYQPDLDQAVVDDLETIVNGFDSHVILSPNAALDRPVVATAWTRLKAYDGADAEIADFVDTYARRGPERVACDF